MTRIIIEAYLVQSQCFGSRSINKSLINRKQSTSVRVLKASQPKSNHNGIYFLCCGSNTAITRKVMICSLLHADLSLQTLHSQNTLHVPAKNKPRDTFKDTALLPIWLPQMISQLLLFEEITNMMLFTFMFLQIHVVHNDIPALFRTGYFHNF